MILRMPVRFRLAAICATVGAVFGVGYNVTRDPIAQSVLKAANTSRYASFPGLHSYG